MKMGKYDIFTDAHRIDYPYRRFERTTTGDRVDMRMLFLYMCEKSME